ncbi:aldo/keto reductase [Candidatus Latescibacterota bacterium]
MKRRTFIKNTTLTASATVAISGCSGLFGPKIRLERDVELRRDPEMLKVTRKNPQAGTMPMSEIGSTGIRVSKFAFGSHMSQDLLPYEKEREFMIREAFDMGINLFDIYDQSWNINQYEPMGKHLAPIINDVVVSVDMVPAKGLTVQQEFNRIRKLLHRDHIDMVRLHARSLDDSMWKEWETLLRFKEKGSIRAVGVAVHFISEINIVLPRVPVDYVIFPYNFYHNLIWDGRRGQKFDSLAEELKKQKIGVITMKPFGTDNFINPMIDAAKELDKGANISLPQAALRHIQNCGLNPDTTLGGMYSANHLYEDIEAYYNPEMLDEEAELLKNIRKKARIYADALMPNHYKFLNSWATGKAEQKTV